LIKTLKERLSGYKQTKYTPIKRTGLSYQQTYDFTHRCLKLCLFVYKRLTVADQTARLVRDVMDFLLRRYHGYCIKENIGAHYFEAGLKHKEKTEFEHVIPAAVARDLLINGRLTIAEALNVPTCKLSKKNHKILNSTKLGSSTPDLEQFWNRYTQVLKVKIVTHQGDPVDTANWDLEKHYSYFNIK
jgi:hypothetical protein